MTPALFVSLLPSTDAEFTRWTLWHYGIPYVEQPHPPIFQAFAAKRTVGSAMSWKTAFNASSDCIVVCNGDKIWPRDAIANYFEARCTPDKKLISPANAPLVAGWWQQYAYGWGWSVARWVYYYLLPEKSLMVPALAGGAVPAGERRVISIGYPLMAAFLRRFMKLSPQLAVQDLAAIHGWFDKMDPVLAKQPYLTGDRFTFADLLFVGYGAPIVMPDGYGAPLPRIDQLPAPMRTEIEAFRQRPTGQYLLRLYAQRAASPV